MAPLDEVCACDICNAARAAVTSSREARAQPELKATNPKDLIGSNKLPLHLWPVVASATGCLALLDGMLKYGRSNWRAAGVRYTVYLDALERHLKKLTEGQDIDEDSGLPQEAHMLACLAIMVDAKAAGKLTDDRLFNGEGAVNTLKALTAHVARLKALHAEKSPKHWTIQDTEGA